MDEWKIKSQANVCAQCQSGFKNLQEVISCVKLEKNMFARYDYCMNCWQTVQSNVQPLSFWQRTHHEPPENPFEDIQALSRFFESVHRRAAEIPGADEVLFVVAMFLLRKRRLKLVSSREQGADVALEFEKCWDGERIILKEVTLTDEKLESVRTNILSLFRSGEGTSGGDVKQNSGDQ